MPTRRTFLGWLGGFIAIPTLGRGIRTADTRLLEPGREASVNVRDFGARGDGVTDDTAAFSRAIVALPASGGTVNVPEGVYMINPVQSILLTSGVHLEMVSSAVLKAIPVDAGNYVIVLVQGAKNVSVRGGAIFGERDGHTGTKGEWGMGVYVRGGADVLLENIEIRDCWGDGIYIGALSGKPSQQITIRGCRSLNNRRQGLSITGCVGALIENSEFSDTHGTAPQAGIDVEPNAPFVVTDVIVRNCVVSRNHGYGIVLSGGRPMGVKGVTLEGNRCFENAFHGVGIVSSIACTVHNNTVERNGRDGLQIAGSNRTSVSGNTIRDNSRRKPLVWDNIIVQSQSSDNLLSDNRFASATDPDSDGPRFDIRIEKRCLNNRLSGNHLRPRRGSLRQPKGGISDAGTDTIIEG